MCKKNTTRITMTIDEKRSGLRSLRWSLPRSISMLSLSSFTYDPWFHLFLLGHIFSVKEKELQEINIKKEEAHVLPHYATCLT